MEKWFSKEGYLLLFTACFFFLWNALRWPAVQTIAIPLFLIYVCLVYHERLPRARLVISMVILILLVFSPLILNGIRNADEKVCDIPAIARVSTQVLLLGKNPYSSNFHGTIIDLIPPEIGAYWISQGQADYLVYDTVPYFPGMFLVTIPFLFFFPGASMAWLMIILLVGLILLLFLHFPNQREEVLAATFFSAFIAQPITCMQFMDILIPIMFLFFLYWMEKGKNELAGISLGIFFMTKGYALILMPFLYYYLWHAKKWKIFQLAVGTIVLLFVPFLLWDASAILNDTILFGIGTNADSLTIWDTRLGLMPMLVHAGILSKTTATTLVFPFAVGILLLSLYLYFRKKCTLQRTLLYGALTVTAMMFTFKVLDPRYLTLPFFLWVGSLAVERAKENDDDK